MDSAQLLSNDSFSYGWVINLRKPSMESTDDALNSSFRTLEEGSFIEVDLKMAPSELKYDDWDFRFDLSRDQTSTPFLDSDKVLSNGVLVPLQFVSPQKIVSTEGPASLPSSSVTSPMPTSKIRSKKSDLKSSRKVSIGKYLGFFLRFFRKSKIKGKRCKGDFRSSSSGFSNKIFDSDIEHSISEAVLHCKKSIGN